MTQIKPKFRIEAFLDCTSKISVNIYIIFEHFYKNYYYTQYPVEKSIVRSAMSGFRHIIECVNNVRRVHSDTHYIQILILTNYKLLLRKSFQYDIPIHVDYKPDMTSSVLQKELDLIPKSEFDKRITVKS